MLPLRTPSIVYFCIGFRGKCCPFFFGSFSCRLSPFIFRFFQSSTCLRFFVWRVFRNELWAGSPEFLGWIFGPKMPLFASRKRQRQSSPFLRFFPEFYFCYGAFLRRVLGSELRELYWMCFRWFRVCVCVWIYLSDSGSSFFLPFSGLRGRCFGFRFPLSLFFLLRLPPFFLGAGLGSLSLLPCLRRQDFVAWSRQVRPSNCFFCVLSLLSFLSPRVGPPLPCSFSFFPSLSLSLSFFLSLSCMQCRTVEPGWT